MEKLRMETKDLTEKNIEKIAALFPNVITEMKDENGKLKKGINFELLKQELSDDVIDGEECYDFTWVGKKAAIVESNTPIRKTLRPCIEESKDWENTENLYIEGDNLEVLKLLQESYLNSIKVIYIDPPYNTGNDFIYKDTFKIEKNEYEEQIGLYDEEEKNMMFKNTDSNGRFHSDWCSMMYPRLKLAQNLLSEDGVIFISIDDNEGENLKKICNEILGKNNFIAQFIWVKKKKGSHLSKTIRSMTEYILCYAKDYSLIELFGESAYSDKQQPLAKRTNSKKDLYFSPGIIKTTLGDGIYKAGEYGEGTSSLNFLTKIKVNNGIVENEVMVNGPFVWTQQKLDTEIKLGTVINLSSKFGFNVLRADQAEKIKRPSTLIDNKVNVGTNEDAYQEVIDIFNEEGIMSYPKPASLLKFLLNTIGYFDKNCTILDFFSGSSTTAQATMQLNADDSGRRKFIMVQLPEKTVENSNAYNAGYENICEIGKERIRRAGEKIKLEIEESNNKLKDGQEPKKVPDIGFRVLKVDSTNMKDVYYSANEYNQEMIGDLESNIKEDRTGLDLLYGVMLDWGLPLSLNHKIEKIEGTTIHIVDNGSLVACFENKAPENAIREIAKLQPLRVVFKDSCFEGSPEKINIEEIFKLLSPNTSIRVI